MGRLLILMMCCIIINSTLCLISSFYAAMTAQFHSTMVALDGWWENYNAMSHDDELVIFVMVFKNFFKNI